MLLNKNIFGFLGFLLLFNFISFFISNNSFGYVQKNIGLEVTKKTKTDAKGKKKVLTKNLGFVQIWQDDQGNEEVIHIEVVPTYNIFYLSHLEIDLYQKLYKKLPEKIIIDKNKRKIELAIALKDDEFFDLWRKNFPKINKYSKKLFAEKMAIKIAADLNNKNFVFIQNLPNGFIYEYRKISEKYYFLKVYRVEKNTDNTKKTLVWFYKNWISYENYQDFIVKFKIPYKSTISIKKNF